MRGTMTTDIGIIAAVPEECSILRRRLQERSAAGDCRIRGRLGEHRVILAVAGIGKVNAAHAATLLIRDHAPAVVMNIGVGGAYPASGLRTGDIAIAGAEVYGDEGVLLNDGFHGLDRIGIPLLRKGRKKLFNELAADKGMVTAAMRSLAGQGLPFGLKHGRFLTVSSCTGTKRRAAELEKRFAVICENMEGAAVAHICAIYNIPFFEMRGISNIVGDRDKAAWDIPAAAENCQKALLKLLGGA